MGVGKPARGGPPGSRIGGQGGPTHGPGHRSRGCPRGRDGAHHGPTWGGRVATLAAIDLPAGAAARPAGCLERLEADRLRNCDLLFSTSMRRCPAASKLAYPGWVCRMRLATAVCDKTSRFAFLADQRHKTFVLPGVNGSAPLSKLKRYQRY